MANKSPLFGAGTHGRSVNVTAQKRVNLYAQVEPIEDKTRIVFYGTAGMEEPFVDLGDTPPRCEIVVNDLSYVVHRQHLYRIDNGGNATLLGDLNTTEGRVGVIPGVDQVLFVDGTNGYVLTTATGAFAQIASGDFPNGATTATWQDGYFIVEDPSTNEFCISTLDDATGWDATERASAEANPDAITRVMSSIGYILLFGPITTELWANSGGLDFPYTRLSGGVIPRGLIAKWSASDFRDGVAGLFTNKDGGVEVGVISGAGYSKISTPDVDFDLQRYPNKGDATGLAYRHSGHSFYQLNFTAANASWLFDADSGLWSELSSSGGRHRAEMAMNFIDRIVVSDFETGKLYRLDPEIYTEAGEAIIWTLVSRHLYFDNLNNPITQLWLDMQTGVTTQDTEPRVMLRVSKDGGHSYGNEITASMGKIGEYQKRVIFRRLGVAYDTVFECRGMGPLPPAVFGEGWVS